MLNRETPSHSHFRRRERRFPRRFWTGESVPKLTSRPKPERIGDESLTPRFSPFVHDQIWWHHQVRTLDAESAAELFARLLA